MSNRFDESALTMFGTVSLGGLIQALRRRKPDQRVSFGFEHMAPDGIDSYRGWYDHLALGFSEKANPFVPEVIALLESAIGRSFMGYKGGSYLMDLKTPVWVANYGNCGTTAIVGIAECDYMTILQTEWVQI